MWVAEHHSYQLHNQEVCGNGAHVTAQEEERQERRTSWEQPHQARQQQVDKSERGLAKCHQRRVAAPAWEAKSLAHPRYLRWHHEEQWLKHKEAEEAHGKETDLHKKQHRVK
ncbi:unnamed protein product [Linum trigynum]|uniref:Uncharacterized protein n=1 Tax=Linum trigynum TaxID=586398 RepID=A0AAV2EC36_9ROSI